MRLIVTLVLFCCSGLTASGQQIPDSLINGYDTYPLNDNETGALLGYMVYTDSTYTTWKEYTVDKPIFYDDITVSKIDTTLIDTSIIRLDISTNTRCKNNGEVRMIPCLVAYSFKADSFCHFYPIKGYQLSETDTIGNKANYKIVGFKFPDAVKRKLYYSNSKFRFHSVLVEDSSGRVIMLSRELPN